MKLLIHLVEQLDILKERLQIIKDSEHSLEIELQQLLAKDEVTKRLIGLDRDFSAEERMLITLIEHKKQKIKDEAEAKKLLISMNKALLKSNMDLFNSYAKDLKAGFSEAEKAQKRVADTEFRLMEINKEKLGLTSEQLAIIREESLANQTLDEMKKKLLTASQAESEGLLIAIGYQQEYIKNLGQIKDSSGETSESYTKMASRAGRAFSKMSQAGVALAKGNK